MGADTERSARPARSPPGLAHPKLHLGTAGAGGHREFLGSALARTEEHCELPRSHISPGRDPTLPAGALPTGTLHKEGAHTHKETLTACSRGSGSAGARSPGTTRDRGQVAPAIAPTGQEPAGRRETQRAGLPPAPRPTPRSSGQEARRGGAASPQGSGPCRRDKVDRRFLPSRLRPPGHIPEKPDSRDASGAPGEQERSAAAAGQEDRGSGPAPPARAAPPGRGPGGRPATGTRAPTRPQPPPAGPLHTWMNWMVSADLPTPPPPTTTSRYFSWPEPSRQPAAAMGTPPSPAQPGHAEPPPALGPAPGTCAAGELRAGERASERAGGRAGVLGARSCWGGRCGRQRGASAGRVPPEARRSGATGGARGSSDRGAREPTRLRSACRTSLQRRYKWPSGGRAAGLVLHMHEGAGRAGRGVAARDAGAARELGPPRLPLLSECVRECE